MVRRQIQKVDYAQPEAQEEVDRVIEELITRGLDAHVKVSLVYDNFGVAGVRLMVYNPPVEQTGTVVGED